MTYINIIILVLAAVATLTGFHGKKVDDDEEAANVPLLKRIRPLGWIFLFCAAAGLSLGIYKELNSFEGQTRSVYRGFYAVAEEVTGFDKAEWNQYISYRLALRFLLQKLYRRVMAEEETLPLSMSSVLATLGGRGALPEELCRRLDIIRYHTHTTEWGVGVGPTPTDLSTVRKVAADSLKELASIAESADPEALTPRKSTECGKNPK